MRLNSVGLLEFSSSCGSGLLAGAANHRVINVRAIRNNGGISLDGRGHLVKDCTLSDGANAIMLQGGTISGCLVQNHIADGIVQLGFGKVLNNVSVNNGPNFSLGTADSNTPIIVDGNSASGYTPKNYNIANNCTGVVITANNAGTP